DILEEKGAKVTGSVTAKTDFLINNDNLSSSTKNKKAKELGIPIITEGELQEMIK
ncbi:BRCT domain-containing protein, partial [Anaerocolumna jejuensis]|uniref:BRCT domain-containing protein n=1 Tax=Anaerocolumna jejuensis TaxID=259063 RepID=UPI003F7B6BC1